jgi:hypothetical protein
LEKPLWLRKYSVPYWVLAEIFGRDANYYHRIECMFGRCSVVFEARHYTKALYS